VRAVQLKVVGVNGRGRRQAVTDGEQLWRVRGAEWVEESIKCVASGRQRMVEAVISGIEAVVRAEGEACLPRRKWELTVLTSPKLSDLYHDLCN
jgi:hypothetical protein